jgi:ParB/RepB/Spo0J family partition protein
MEIKTVKLSDIVSDDNRKHAKDDGFEQLVASVKALGVIEPPAVRALEGGGYKIIAGRRRVAALRKLKEEEAECRVYAAGDPGSDEEIALAENVNRLEMHPLDETELFAHLADKGLSAVEIAKYYARSPSAIYKRLRLRTLTKELKGMFRKGQLDIGGAAVLAELPEEDQKEFFNLNGEYEEYDENDEIEAIDAGEITEFLYKKQRNKIKNNMSKICANCAKRTHNEHNALFEEYRYLDDVCLDGECYRVKWHEMISAALKAQIIQTSEAGIETDEKIFFAGDTVEQLYKRADKVRFKIGKEETEFEVLSDKKYENTGETNRKTGACWLVRTARRGEGNERIDVRRVGYKEIKKEASGEKVAGAGKKINDKINAYGHEALKAAAEELQMPSAAEVAKKLEEKQIGAYYFENDIMELVFKRVVAMRIEKDKENKKPRDYLPLFLEALDEDGSFQRRFDENRHDDFQKECLIGLFGKMNTTEKIASLLDEEAQGLFHFLLVSILDLDYLPNIDDVKKIGKEKHIENQNWYIFWKYAGMSVEEYTALYLQAAKDVAAAALKPEEKKPKAELKKKKNEEKN